MIRLLILAMLLCKCKCVNCNTVCNANTAWACMRIEFYLFKGTHTTTRTQTIQFIQGERIQNANNRETEKAETSKQYKKE